MCYFCGNLIAITKGLCIIRSSLLQCFIVIEQQTKKKPLVTKLLTGYSYRRGRRCDDNYDQFLSFGQVIPEGIHRQHDSGERRWFPKKPILDRNLIVPIIWGHSLFVVFARLVKSCLRIAVSVAINKESQVLVVPDFQKILSITAYSAKFQALVAPFSAMPLFWGRGFCIPSQFLQRKDSRGCWHCQKLVRGTSVMGRGLSK